MSVGAVATARVTSASLAQDLRRLGMAEGSCVLLHVSLRGLGEVEGGPAAVVEAVRTVIGAGGTIVVPTTTDGNSDTSRAYRERTRGMSPLRRRLHRRRMPAFDPASTPSSAGAVAEFVRTRDGAVRSEHPQSSFAAIGPAAGALMGGHAPDCHLGEASPLARLYETGAHILMLGIGYAACTAFHLAEYRYAPDPPTRRYACVVRRGRRARWWSYEDVVLDDSEFSVIGAELDATALVRHSAVGRADGRLIRLDEAVRFAAGWFAARRR
ncbi:AAC(3) family N-acetyltransferase [Actinomadura sp. DC4]|uniref:aminoglycoside N(3)-acetyltransferase n=1 Tax=Actinomadura sp. DC4 TaxID=3055069 RepID=UPI0025AF3568|nr:AAC(3) family N-acetyltransferase [Actinomadura sp. DC4]MDN3359124.1 AAC(3) family N-acetyltransferase [Actinomadura sp. DC4]